MNETAKAEKIRRFLADKEMASYIKDVFLQTFLKPTKQPEVQYLAASRIAIDLLLDGFKELEKYRTPARETPAATGQPGL